MENNNSSANWTDDKLGPDPFDIQNFSEDNFANGTTKEMFDRRNVIDRKNLVEIYVGRLGIKWELAAFEKMFTEPDVTVEDLYRDGGFLSSSDPAIFVCFIAEVIDGSKRSAIGYAIIFNGYSTWQGRILKLKDLYVRDGYRKLGVGKKLIEAIAAHAKEVNAARLYFHVLEWNTSARRFYESVGATNGTESEEWALLRLDRNAIENLVENVAKPSRRDREVLEALETESGRLKGGSLWSIKGCDFKN